MTTIELSPTPLPHEPPPYDGRHEHRPDYLRAYDLTLDAERYSDEQTEANPSNQEAKHNLMFARVAGYFLLEFSNRWTILSETPYVSLVEQITSPPRDGDTVHDVVFGVGRWYFNHLLRTCTFGFFPTSFCVSVSSQFGRPLRPYGTIHPSHYPFRLSPSTRWRRRRTTTWRPMEKIIEPPGIKYAHLSQRAFTILMLS